MSKDKISCIIVDDEPLARKGVELNVNELPWLEIMGQFPNAIQASEYLENNNVDLMFLDIEMPGIKGLDFLRTLKSDAVVILTTAYPQYALDAFELNVCDYLVKPIRFDRFFKAVNSAKEIIMLRRKDNIEVSDITEDYFYIKSDRKYVKLQYKEILWIKGMKDYVMIFTDTTKYMTAMNLKTILSKLPTSLFARVSKSYIINVNSIDEIDVDSIFIKKEEILLSQTYKEDFLNNHIRGKLFKR